jgi:hypothetical protein
MLVGPEGAVKYVNAVCLEACQTDSCVLRNKGAGRRTSLMSSDRTSGTRASVMEEVEFGFMMRMDFGSAILIYRYS